MQLAAHATQVVTVTCMYPVLHCPIVHSPATAQALQFDPQAAQLVPLFVYLDAHCPVVHWPDTEQELQFDAQSERRIYYISWYIECLG